MDLAISVEAVLGALETAASGTLGGAAGEMGRRAAEGLTRLLGRGRRAGEDGDGGGPPVGEDELRRFAEALHARARTDPGFARELLAWMREAGGPRLGTGLRGVPRVLPAASGVFTDREPVLAALEELLDGEEPPAAHVAVLTGQGGIGKTATAVHCAHRLKDRFPDGQLFVRLGGPAAASAARPAEALSVLLGDLGVAAGRVPADPRRQENLYRDLTADRRLLVLLDDASSEAQVRPLIPATPGSLVIVTSRYRLAGLAGDPGARFLTLDPLPEADAVLLLERVAATSGRRSEARDAARMAAVARGCGRVPLALCETGALVASRAHLSWETVERRLAGPVPGNPEGMDDRNGTDAVRRAHDLAYRELSAEAARLYRLLGHWPGPETGVAAAARVADTTEGAARVLLEELAGVHLLQEVGEERYRFHDLVRADAERRARAEDDPAELAASVRRAAVWYLRFAAAADHRVMPGRWHLGPAYQGLTLPADRDPHDGRAALAALRRERANLAAAVRAAETCHFDDLVWQLCEATWALHLRLGFHDQWIDTHRRGVAAARRQAQELGDARAVGRMQAQLAFAYMGRGRWDEAETALHEATDADRAAGHLRGQATAVESLGLLRLRQRRWQEARDCFTTAQGLLRSIGAGEAGATDVPRGLALLEDHIGRALRGAGRYAEAVRTLYTALALFRALPDRDLYNEGRVYMNLGETHLAAADPAAARLCLDEALAVMESEGAELQEADAAELRARCAEDEERRVSFLRRAEELYERGGDAVGLARVREGLGGG
ncbi:XRE family transcriptional regulator [Streptomyces mobaraensis NBRC 13819 = DSM 40847]|uniref:XRE family transcriptional regulator n=1 Tax=Streptomyces mobaraensis (strain ATCC 29032 / DSM 40847 / JCM 4168 / NBRC 13819 / NCIMB 11159 / IPCR 16-22) TaxID=1223523 RepID=M3BZ00_STRM1|nr:tetratricopeptide repeat protein [Streptomyces mobaraensis]EME96985.1 XRE family transcriptional regulator [Streptomyces mobaraensis NBRC 13819 = DSM 40847]